MTDKELNTNHPVWRYEKKGLHEFSYVEWKKSDAVGCKVTMFIPTKMSVEDFYNADITKEEITD